MEVMSKLQLIDYEKLTESSTPIPIGDVVHLKKDYITSVLEDLFTVGKDTITTIPACSCGATSNLFYLNTVCPECNTLVTDVYVTELKFKSKLYIPDPVPEVLHPKVFEILCSIFTKQLMVKILDPRKRLAMIYADTIPQGMIQFRKNFRNIISRLLELKKSVNPTLTENLNAFLDRNEDKLWIRDLPIMDKSLQHITSEKGAFKVDPSAVHLMKAITTLSETWYKLNAAKVYSAKYVDSSIFELYTAYTDYVNCVLEDKLLTKEGLFRKHLLGARYHFSFRGVVVPICEVHQSDHIHLPWRIGVSVYQLLIYNLLINRMGYTINQAFDIYRKAEVRYCPIVDSIFKTLIDESPGDGLTIIMGRNPSLRIGSIQSFVVPRIKSDVSDKSIGLSAGTITSANGKHNCPPYAKVCA